MSNFSFLGGCFHPFHSEGKYQTYKRIYKRNYVAKGKNKPVQPSNIFNSYNSTNTPPPLILFHCNVHLINFIVDSNWD